MRVQSYSILVVMVDDDKGRVLFELREYHTSLRNSDGQSEISSLVQKQHAYNHPIQKSPKTKETRNTNVASQTTHLRHQDWIGMFGAMDPNQGE